ncbi:MAG: hypothetical protein K2R98_31690 [Gemmataceae bacterium]|nr:hypothetical protein [Gemmataceae bacterium]
MIQIVAIVAGALVSVAGAYWFGRAQGAPSPKRDDHPILKFHRRGRRPGKLPPLSSELHDRDGQPD